MACSKDFDTILYQNKRIKNYNGKSVGGTKGKLEPEVEICYDDVSNHKNIGKLQYTIKIGI